MFLLEANPNILQDLIQTGGMLGIMGFFLMYFMKEQKELRTKVDSQTAKHEDDMKDLRRVYDDKVEGMVKRMDELTQKTVTALNDNRESNEKLTDTLNSFIAQMKKA